MSVRGITVPWIMLQREETFDPLKDAVWLTHYSAACTAWLSNNPGPSSPAPSSSFAALAF